MAFKVLLRSTPGEFQAGLSAAFEEQTATLVAPVDLDWRDGKAVGKYFEEVMPAVVVNYGFARDVESGDFSALDVLVDHCRIKDVPFIHFSSYRVFGTGELIDESLSEDAAPSPQDLVGERLLALETRCSRLPKHLILRQSWGIGGEIENLLPLLVPQLLGRDVLHASDHNFGRPVSVAFLAGVVLALTQQILCGAENWGVFHAHASDRCSEAELCDALVRLISSDERFSGVRIPEIAGVGDQRRIFEGHAALEGNRLTDNFGIQLPTWRKGLKAKMKRFLESYSEEEIKSAAEGA